MNGSIVSLVRYEKPLDSVRQAVDLAHGLDHMPRKARVFIKPNIVFWTRHTDFPKWGVLTTSRVIQDMVVLLKERGIDDITIGEGIATGDPKDKQTPAHAFESLGYKLLEKRYGTKVMNIFDRPFGKVDLGSGVVFDYNPDILASDFVVNLPVLKTHSLAVVSLGIKNFLGMTSIRSRQDCHSVDPLKDLNYNVARLANKIPASLTLIDGIYTLERGPLFDGKSRRSNILVASADVFAADLVGAKLLGFDPSEVPHIVHAAEDRSRPTDLSDVVVVGEKIQDLASHHEWEFLYNEEGTLSLSFVTT
jgi:uncharacterized protein (DUF362 family)